jgi:hypothetical protein
MPFEPPVMSAALPSSEKSTSDMQSSCAPDAADRRAGDGRDYIRDAAFSQ